MKRLWFVFSGLWMAATAGAEIKLASPFSDHMVLQRDQEVRIFGTARAAAQVTVSIADQAASATADKDGHFVAILKPLPAGGPFKLEAKAGNDSTAIDDVLIGDVWLCSGQSNMQMSLKEVVNAPAEIATAKNHPQMRLLTIAKAFADKPQTTFAGSWKTCTPKTAADFSAVGYHFADELYKSPKLANVPIGLIDSSFGGTAVEGWIPASELPSLPTSQQSASMFGIPSGFYNQMIAPLAPFNLKGVLWYQGESNASHPQQYANLLTKMIEAWRRDFQSTQLPFFIVELPPNNGDWGGYYFVWLREMERQVAWHVPAVGLATTVNTHDGSDLHPREKHEIGTRLALLARHDVYGENIVARGPVLKSTSVDGSQLRITFDTFGSPLTAKQPNALRGFELAGEDGKYFFANAKIDGDSVVVHSDHVPAPKTVRYAWQPIPQADLYNAAGLPAAPFRTDDAPVEPLIEVIPQPAPRRVSTPDYEVTISGSGKVTDLIVHGQQLLSNAAAPWGGSSIPMGWGTRELRDIQDLGPGSMVLSDKDLAATVSFEQYQIVWDLKNSSDSDINLRFAIALPVEVSNLSGNTIHLKRGDAKLALEGISVVNGTPEGGKLLEIAVPKKGSATLMMKIE